MIMTQMNFLTFVESVSPLIEGKEVTEEYCTFLPKPEHKTKVKGGGEGRRT